MTDNTKLSAKHTTIIARAADVVRDRGYDGDARLADSLLGIIRSAASRATDAPAQGGTVPIPTTTEMATAMVNIGLMWLKENAPEAATSEQKPVADAVYCNVCCCLLTDSDHLTLCPESIPLASEQQIELAAKAIYAKFDMADKYPWVEHGNSDMQDTARRYARAALAGAPVASEQKNIEWGRDLQARLIAMGEDQDDSVRNVMAEAACLLAALTGRAALAKMEGV